MTLNGTTTLTWSFSTLNHVLLTGEANSILTLTRDGGSSATDAKVSVGFPVWFD